jgi:tellurite resistance protein
MRAFTASPLEAQAGLRAMATCARADGAFTPTEAALITSAAQLLGAPLEDPQALASIEPDELQAALSDPAHREAVVQAMILLSVMDGDASGAEAAVVERFAKALGVDEPRVANLRQLSMGRVRTLWLDLARRSFARPIFERTLKEKGPMGVWKIVGPMLGLAKDPALADRFVALGQLPEDTLGYAYFRFVVDHQLGFPGEGLVAEEGLWHDLTHVLGGYDTSPQGEVSVVCFIAGYVREDPFFWLFTIALQFHLGIRVSPYSPAGHGVFEPAMALAAFQRGLRVNRDLSRDWNPWPHMGRSLDEVRAELGVS